MTPPSGGAAAPQRTALAALATAAAAAAAGSSRAPRTSPRRRPPGFGGFGDGRLSGGSGGGGGSGQRRPVRRASGALVRDGAAGGPLAGLVQACGLERQPGHLEGVLELLGPAPPPSRPGALALWLAALLNPIPPLGVAPELRPRVLLSPSPDERLAVVYAGLARSLAHLEDTRRGGGGGGSRASISW